MREMTITQALVELKTLDSRINKAVNKEMIGIAKNSDKDTESWKTFAERATANLASAVDLINERSKIKSAIVKSNATTTVKVGEVEMTVAEAIERKSSISYEEDLCASMKRQYAACHTTIEAKNAEVQRKLDNLLESLVGADKKGSADEVSTTSEAYIAKNGYCVVDPIDIQKAIDMMEDRITSFLANVDIALSVSNAKTVITIE